MATTNYITIAEVSEQTGVDVTKYEDHVNALITAVSEGINNFCKRPDGFVADSVATARDFVGGGQNFVRTDEFVEVTAVGVKNSITNDTFESWTSDDYIPFRGSIRRPNFNPLDKDEPMPYTGLIIPFSSSQSLFTSGIAYGGYIPGFRPNLDRSTYDTGQPTVRVTAKWGYATTVPDAVKQACIIQVSRFFKRSQAQWADALANGEFQELRFVKPTDPAYDFLVNWGGFRKPQIG